MFLMGGPKKNAVKPNFAKNAACRASLSPDDIFCKTCSCCICHQFDDNKDPSLWLTCESDSLDKNESCGMSCHLECALTDERAGIIKSNCYVKLDGNFYCVACGKINGLMREAELTCDIIEEMRLKTWRKQLLVAKETRRVDVLCLRISLGHKILIGSKKYEEVKKMVETALQTLENEVGPLNLLCTKLARGIVNRLSCGPKVQKLCASAMEAFDSMVYEPCSNYVRKKEPTCEFLQIFIFDMMIVRERQRELHQLHPPSISYDVDFFAACQIQFEELSPTSVIIVLDYAHNLIEGFLGYRIWHWKSTENACPDNPTFIALRPQQRFRIMDLNPSTEYFCKVSLFSRKKKVGVWAKWVTPASSENFIAALVHEKEETLRTAQIDSQVNSTNLSNIEPAFEEHDAKLPMFDEVSKRTNDRLHSPRFLEKVHPLSPSSLYPSTPCKLQKTRAIPLANCKKKLEENDYEYAIRMVKWLEHEGHMDKDFRVKFLTWFSHKVTKQERRVVSVFVDALIDDPAGLAEQISHTFMDEIYCEQKPISGQKFCARLWH